MRADGRVPDRSGARADSRCAAAGKCIADCAAVTRFRATVRACIGECRRAVWATGLGSG